MDNYPIRDRIELQKAAANVQHIWRSAGREIDRKYIYHNFKVSPGVSTDLLHRRRWSIWRWLAALFSVVILSGCIPAYTTIEPNGLRDRTFTTYHEDGITVKSSCSWSSFIIGGIKQTSRFCEWFREDGSRMWKSGRNELIPTKQGPAKQIVPDISPPGRFNQT